MQKKSQYFYTILFIFLLQFNLISQSDPVGDIVTSLKSNHNTYGGFSSHLSDDGGFIATNSPYYYQHSIFQLLHKNLHSPRLKP